MKFLMKFRRPLFFSVLLLSVLVAAFYPKADSSQKEAILMRTIFSFMNQLHYEPQEVNDEFSEEFFDLYLERINAKRYLSQEDIAQLAPYRRQLDDEVRQSSYDFFNKSLEMLENNLKTIQVFNEEILAQPFDFDRKEDINLDFEEVDYAENEKALRDRWRQILKYETMTRLYRKTKAQNEVGEEGERKSMDDLEAESRKEVKELYEDIFKRMLKLKRENRMSAYFNAFTNIYDPHSTYFEPVEKESFDIDMSGRLEGIGARLFNEGDYTKVSEVMPGGPAWKGKELEKGDLIIKVAQDDDGEWEDITGMLVNEVVQKIRGKPGTKVRLTIKKKDGSLKEISIIRDVIIIEESYAKSLILDGAAEGEKIGYINLPRFYVDFENPDGRFCSKDIATELDKLTAAGVDGIILDLRNNGGGGLYEAIDMSGLFIEKGPIVQVKSRRQKPEILEDANPEVSYNGPLVVLVNQLSASASEILAAALQDYGRAVIVGSKSTYGKGTVQRFFDMDRAVRGMEEIKPLGDIKLTMQKFYRVDGGAVQLKGVVPDIILPDTYAYINIGEKEEERAMEWTEIEPVDFDQDVYKIKNLQELKERSEARVSKNPTFQQVVQNAKRYERLRENSVYPLNMEAYQQKEKAEEQEAEQFKDMFDAVVNKGVYNLDVDLDKVNKNEKNKSMNKDFMEIVSKDIYISETLNILHDMISLK
jgi:carboxyl-terminal processing protease